MDRAPAPFELYVRPRPAVTAGAVRPRRDARVRRFDDPCTPVVRTACASPRDLCAAPARETIGRVLSGWLARHRVTPFELLHRADLAERLEACEAELSAALYNAALAEAAARGLALDRVRQRLGDLVRRALDRVIADDDPDIAFRLGVAVAARLARQTNWRDKLEALLELFEAAPDEGAPAQVSMRVLQQPLTDILAGCGDLGEIFGVDHAPGERLMLLMQIASAPALAAAANLDGELAWRVPRLNGLAARLALVLHGRPTLARARRAIVRRVLTMMASSAWLWPADRAREAEGVQALAELLAVSGRLVDQQDVAAALAGRLRRLAAAIEAGASAFAA
jgi:hypothetical protein